MAQTPIRDRKTRETRARIAEAALELFVTQGYAETTIDQIAAAAGVGRRTVFRHFATKEAMLFDHLAGRRDQAIDHLQERPATEPPLVSLYAVLREMCEPGYDRRLLAQIRAVLTAEPRVAGEQLSLGTRSFEQRIVAVLGERWPDAESSLEIHALTLMATGWFTTAVHLYLTEGRRSLVECFDQVVEVCARSSARDLM